MDWSVTHALNTFFAHHDSVEDPLTGYVQASELLFVAMLIGAFVFVRRRGVQRAVVAAGLSAGLALALGAVISALVDRARPFVAHPDAVHLFAKHAADAGFPSDHATAAFAIAVAILVRYRVWGGVVLALATLLSFGRVAIGVHYPSDVIAGAALGAASALALWAPPVRARLHRLADLAAWPLDALLGARRGTA